MRSSPPAPLSERTAASSGIARPIPTAPQAARRNIGKRAKSRPAAPLRPLRPLPQTEIRFGNDCRAPSDAARATSAAVGRTTTPETTHTRNGPARRTIRAHAPIRAERMHSVAARPERAVAASRRWRKDNGTEKGCRSVATFRETPSRPRCGSHGGESRIRAETRPAALRRLRPTPRAKIRSGHGCRAPATRGGCGRCRR